MPEHDSDYYVNHGRAERFPWTLYHAPISDSLFSLIRQVAQEKGQAKILVIGPGAFIELKNMPANCRFTCIDIDQRVISDIQKITDPRIEAAVHVSATSDLHRFKGFDLIYAKEVIEHITEPDAYMDGLKQALVVGGRVWLSTPNYGFFLLPFLESTILEVIARRDGYTRKHIHPNRYSRSGFLQLFQKHSFRNAQVQEVACKMALIGIGQK